MVLYKWRLLNGRLGLRMAVWLQARVRERGLRLWPTLYPGSLCRKAPLQLEYVAIYTVVY